MSLEQAFDTYFTASETCVNFEVYESGKLLQFNRIDRPAQAALDHGTDPEIDGQFVAFEELIKRYSRWHGQTIEFKFLIDGDLKVHYQYDPNEMILPNLLKHVPKDDIVVLDFAIYFHKRTKKVLKQLEDELVGFLKHHFNLALTRE